MVLGEEPFSRLASRLGSIDGRTHRTALASMDVRGASLVLILAELGYRAPGEGVLDQLVERTVGHGGTVAPLLDAAAFARWAESASEADVAGDLLERIADPGRTARWSDAQRAAYERADLSALARSCEEPERTESWNEATRRSNRELAAALVEPVRVALTGEPAVVALDGCVLAGEAGLLAGLRTVGLELAPLVEREAAPTAPVVAPTVPSSPGAPAPSADPGEGSTPSRGSGASAPGTGAPAVAP